MCSLRCKHFSERLKPQLPLQQRLADQTRFVQKRDNAVSQTRAKLGNTDQIQQAALDETQAETEAAHEELKRIKAEYATQNGQGSAVRAGWGRAGPGDGSARLRLRYRC